MLPEWLSVALLALIFLSTLWLVFRPHHGARESAAQGQRLDHLERELRDEVARSAQGTRAELGQTLASFQRTLLAQQGDVARTQNEQIDSFRTQLAATQQMLADTLRHTTQSLADQSLAAREAQASALQRLADQVVDQLRALSLASDQRQGELRGSVEMRLAALQQGNEAKLEQMRATVDEKLHATLEQRLGESFRQVAERLEQVHKGLGEMQALAKDVGSLNRVLTNVKSRGVFGEVQLAGLLEQVFTPDQYATNVQTVPGSNARVEFAVRLPGRHVDAAGGAHAAPLWLPIDAKFPREDYERLLDAQDRADAPAAEAAGRALEQRLRLEAKTIQAKYVAPPHTTEFAILFVPTEGLYAEALRRPGLMEALQREHRVTLAGPTTLLATLTSLQMGFRTLALEQRSAEVWQVLGAVKTEFQKFGDVLAKTKKKLDEASGQIDSAQRRTRMMTRALGSVEALDEHRAAALLIASARTGELALAAEQADAPVDGETDRYGDRDH